RALLAWINIVQRHKVMTIILCFITVLVSIDYTRNNLGMNTDTEDMLSPDLDWRKLDRELSEEFPQFSSNILVVIEAPSPDQAMDAADKLDKTLTQETTLFKSVFSFRSLPFFKKSSLLYLEADELQDVSDRLAEIQPFLAKLTEDQNIRGLFNMLEKALRAKIDGDKIELSPLIRRVNETLDAISKNQAYQLSWHSLMAGEELDKEFYREFIILQPELDYSDLFPAEAALEKIRTLGNELAINAENNLRLRLTGSAALSHEELQSVMVGTQLSIILALCMVTVIMIVGLGSFWLVLATIITLISGLLITAAWATLTVGELNLISVAFAVLYIGLGVDFAIHFCLRFREYFLNNNDRALALYETSKSCGNSLFLCAVTTAIGFYAFMPTDYDGIAELGWISGSGMFISFIMTMTLLPALLVLFPFKPKARTYSSDRTSVNSLLAFPVTHARTIKIISFIIIIPLIWLIPKIKFDHNTLNLQNPENESVQTYMDLLADSESTPWTTEILVDNENEARSLEAKLKALPLVDDVTWLNKFIPDEQDEKLTIIEEIDLILSGMNLHSDLPAPTVEDRIIAIDNLILLMISRQKNIDQIPHATDLLNKLESFMTQYTQLDEQKRNKLLMRFEYSLLASLPGRLNSLEASLEAEAVDETSLPSELSSRWVGQNGRYLLEISPVENLQNNEALERFVKQLQSNFSNIIGSPVVSVEAGKAVVSAFKQAFITAFIVISLLLLILMDKRRDALLIMTPLIMAAMLTAATSVVFSIPLNFANIIALPLLLGIGVDSGIHILHRYRTAPPENGIILATSSARAVLVSALTTIVSIGNLAFSSHVGTASMGKLLTIGISMTLLCTLIILPSLLATTKTGSSNKS
ncbi:MAG: MMPL family transporter, partial [Gammaproteobacteria bacterium]|nr:MMPL family transporter [Gammaproteobacteria bacterium]